MTSLRPKIDKQPAVNELLRDELKTILIVGENKKLLSYFFNLICTFFSAMLLLLILSFVFCSCWILLYLIKLVRFEDDMLLDDDEVSIGEKALNDVNVQCWEKNKICSSDFFFCSTSNISSSF